MIEVSVQAHLRDAASWLQLSRRCEAAGVRALLVADHPGIGASPFVALAAAAAVTERLRLGSYVVNAGIREAMHIASDVATLDVLSAGRAELGIGAGHTPIEWETIGRTRPDGPERVRRLIQVAAAVQDLLAGLTVPAEQLQALADVKLDEPRAVQQPVPILVGGTSRTLLRWGGAHADAVGLTGLGPTGSDGHTHSVSWSSQQLEGHLLAIADGARDANRPMPALEVLVQAVEVTDDAAATYAALAADTGATVDELVATPYVLIGTESEILTKMLTTAQRWSITRWAVREPALETAEQLLQRLAARG